MFDKGFQCFGVDIMISSIFVFHVADDIFDFMVIVGLKKILLLFIVGSFISLFFGGLILSLSFFSYVTEKFVQVLCNFFRI